MSLNINNLYELEQCLKSNKFAIYGTGYVAKRFFQSLKKHELLENLMCFITSKKEDDYLDEIRVITHDELERNSNIVICVAVHASIKNDIIDKLCMSGHKKYVWIYPFQYELMLGAPVEKNTPVLLKEILDNCYEDYRMAIRYLAIENYYNKNNNGYEIYLKLMELHCSEMTAQRRLQQFIELIRNCEKYGYDSKQTPLLLENKDIIDGTHRIALSSYLKKNYIICDIYPMTKNIEEIHDSGCILTKRTVIENGIPLKIIQLLEDANDRIREYYQ